MKLLRQVMIRPVCLSDLSSVIALINREISGGVNIFRLVPLDEIAAQRWWSLHGEGRYQAIVAEQSSELDTLDSGVCVSAGGADADGQPTRRFAGWATFTPHSAYEGYDRTAELSVWVEPQARRNGCGRALIQGLLATCKTRNLRTVISRIESNNIASIRLHEVCGFTHAGLLADVGEKFGQSLSVILMQYHAEPPPHPAVPDRPGRQSFDR